MTTKKREMILRVRNYFEKTVEGLKAREIDQSTADATGVSHATVERKQKKETGVVSTSGKIPYRKEVKRRDLNGSLILCCHPSVESYIHFSSVTRDRR